jgi:hypothetical protein
MLWNAEMFSGPRELKTITVVTYFPLFFKFLYYPCIFSQAGLEIKGSSCLPALGMVPGSLPFEV